MADTSPFKPNALAGRVALITGGGSGIGLEITRQLGLHGAKVVISGRREGVLKEACAQLGAEGIEAHFVQVRPAGGRPRPPPAALRYALRTRSASPAQPAPVNPPPVVDRPPLLVQGDVRAYEQCQRMAAEAVARFGSLSVLVNCAAGNFLAAAEQLTSNGFKTVVDIDTLGTFNMSRCAADRASRLAKPACSKPRWRRAAAPARAPAPADGRLPALRRAAFSALSRAGGATIVNISATLHYGATWYQAHASAAKVRRPPKSGAGSSGA